MRLDAVLARAAEAQPQGQMEHIAVGCRSYEPDGFGAMALTSDTVVFYSNGQAQMIHKGDTTWQAICANPRSFATIVRGAPAIDCVEVLGGVLGFPTKIRFRRIDAAGRMSDDTTLDVESPDRVVAAKDMDLRALVEDELILALPYAPRHDGCEARPEGSDRGASSPFAGLRGMMQRKH